jgi:hypothetical protein
MGIRVERIIKVNLIFEATDNIVTLNINGRSILPRFIYLKTLLKFAHMRPNNISILRTRNKQILFLLQLMLALIAYHIGLIYIVRMCFDNFDRT